MADLVRENWPVLLLVLTTPVAVWVANRVDRYFNEWRDE